MNLSVVASELSEQSYQDIPAVLQLKSSKPSPKKLGLIACTHGNERAGIAIFTHLLERFTFKKSPVEIYLIIGNPRAMIKQQRYIDHDLNRIFASGSHTSYEYHRAQQLIPLLQQMDVLIDLHTISLSNIPMAICSAEHIDQVELVCHACDYLLIEQMKERGALISAAQDDTLVFGIECGHHTAPSSVEVGLSTIFTTIDTMTNPQTEKTPARSLPTFAFVEELIAQADGFRFLNNYTQFHHLPAGLPFATDQSGQLYQHHHKHREIYLGLTPQQPQLGEGESAGFLFEQHY